MVIIIILRSIEFSAARIVALTARIHADRIVQYRIHVMRHNAARDSVYPGVATALENRENRDKTGNFRILCA